MYGEVLKQDKQQLRRAWSNGCYWRAIAWQSRLICRLFTDSSGVRKQRKWAYFREQTNLQVIIWSSHAGSSWQLHFRGFAIYQRPWQGLACIWYPVGVHLFRPWRVRLYLQWWCCSSGKSRLLTVRGLILIWFKCKEIVSGHHRMLPCLPTGWLKIILPIRWFAVLCM